MKSPGKHFAYVILRGVHFQYTDHYSSGATDKNLPIEAQYEKAVRYSKQDFFEKLLAEVDRNRTAIVYTSDHGQNISDDDMPHCSVDPEASEFSVPLVVFLPSSEAQTFSKAVTGPRSASQIFPTTMKWMGYPSDYAQSNYDNILFRPSKRLIWFGRNVVPVDSGDRIDISPIPDE